MARIALLLSIALLSIATAWADLQINLRRDKVELNDGTIVECVVLMQGARGVLVVVPDPESEEGAIQKLIPAWRVKKVTIGEDEGEIKGLKTEEYLARKIVSGSGFRKDGKEAEEQPPVAPTGPVAPLQPLVTPQPEPGPAEHKPVVNSRLKPDEIAAEYLSRFPDLGEAAQIFMGGADQIPQLFKLAQKGDPIVREQLQGFLELFLHRVEPPAQQQGRQPKEPAPAQPARPSKKKTAHPEAPKQP